MSLRAVRRFAALAAAVAAEACSAAVSVDVSFRRDAWTSNDWMIVKSPRWDYMHGFVQRADRVENECPPVSGEDVFRKHGRAVYSAMVYGERAAIGQTISATMGFDWRMAPLIVIAEKLDVSPEGQRVLGEHWEVVLHDEGINVWHHMIKDGEPFWYRAAYLAAKFERDVPYRLEVRLAKTCKGVKEMIVKCAGHELGYVDNDLPDAFYAGIIGCEGRNSFYDFSIR